MTDRNEMLKRLRPTIAFVLPLILVVAMALVLRAREQNRPIAFTVDMPSTVVVDPTQSVVQVPITLNLENRRRHDIDLIANSDCEIFQWFMIDGAGSFVQGQALEGCGDQAVADVVRGRGTLVRTTTIPLYTSRLQTGQRYRIALRFWGYETATQFRVRVED